MEKFQVTTIRNRTVHSSNGRRARARDSTQVRNHQKNSKKNWEVLVDIQIITKLSPIQLGVVHDTSLGKKIVMIM